MGDGYADSLVFDKVFYSIAPKCYLLRIRESSTLLQIQMPQRVLYLKFVCIFLKNFLMNNKTAFVIPCYNEQENIEDLIASCKEIIIKSNSDIEFILVNNGSKDSTASLIKQGSNSKIHL